MKAKPTPKRHPSRKPASKHQRLKIAILPVLLLVLAYVVLAPGDDADSDTVPYNAMPSHAPLPAAAPAVASAPGAAQQSKGPLKKEVWPEVSLQFLASANPFQSLTTEPADVLDRRLVGTGVQPIGDDLNSNLQGDQRDDLNISLDNEADNRRVDPLADMAGELERRPVNFVFRSSKQSVVMLGDEILKEGDQLSPAVHVHDIGDHSLLLKLQP